MLMSIIAKHCYVATPHEQKIKHFFPGKKTKKIMLSSEGNTTSVIFERGKKNPSAISTCKDLWTSPYDKYNNKGKQCYNKKKFGSVRAPCDQQEMKKKITPP